MQSISLVGMPGCGKSTVGRHLARQLGLRFVDSDTRRSSTASACRSATSSPRRVKPAFRDVESDVIEALAGERGVVLATGGGAVLRPSNRDALHSRMHVFYLRATPEDLHRRLRNDTHRPLLQVANPLRRLRELYRERDPLYRRAAHFVVESVRPSVPALTGMVLMQLELAGLVDPAQVPSPIGSHAGDLNCAAMQAANAPVPDTLSAATRSVTVATARPPLRHPHRRRPAAGARRLDGPAARGAGGDREQPHGGCAVRQRAAKQAIAPHYGRVSRVLLPDGEQHKDWTSLNLDLRPPAGHRLRPQDGAVRPGRRRRRRHDRLCRRHLHARRALRAGADHAAGAGGFVGRRQDRHQPPARQEHDRRLLPARARDLRPGHAGHAATPRAVRRAGRGHQIRADRRHGLPRLDRGPPGRPAGP